MKKDLARTEAVRLCRELRREKAEKQFYEQLALAAGVMAGIATGALLAVAQATGML